MTKVGFIPGMQGWFNYEKWIIIHLIKEIKNSIWSSQKMQGKKKKAFDQTQHIFTIKILKNLAIEENFLNLRKGIYKNPQLTSYCIMKNYMLPT